MTATPPIPLSVVMPAYNEEAGIRDAVAAVQQQVLDLVPGSEAVVVNDGSKDRTGPILDALAAEDPRIRVLHTPNGGHGVALIRALTAARGEYLFLIDSDDQIPLEGFRTLWALRTSGNPHRDGVFGIRRVRHDARFRRGLTLFIGWCLFVLLRVRLRDANVPFKLVHRDAWAAARPLIPDDTLAPSLFLSVIMKRQGRSIAFVDVAHRDRATGEVSIRRWKLIKFCARAFRQLMALRRSLPAT